jgi:glycosyltransferase involved in cell wall biosynthesis
MACGTPVIASDRASLPEIVGDAGLYVAPDDVDGLARAMHKLATDPELRQTLSQAALAQSARFTWSKTAHGTLSAYRRALASPLRPFPSVSLRLRGKSSKENTHHDL